MTAVLGLDIGGTKIAGLLADSRDQTLAYAATATPNEDPARLVQTAAALIADLLAQANLTPADLATVGVGIPGRVEAATGAVATAVNLNLDHYPLGAVLADHLGVPVCVENDVRAAAVGAYHHLFADDDTRSLAYLNLGTGVSAGVVVNGRLYRGRHGMAGEIGHIVVEPNGSLCNCGQRGCLETVIAGPALGELATAVLASDSPLSAADLYYAAANGHPAAASHIHHITQSVVFAIQWLALTYDVDQIVIGGGVTQIGTPFLDPVLAALNQLRTNSPLLQTMLPSGMVKVLPAHFNAGIWGAIRLARAANNTNPIYFQQEGEITK